MTYPATRRERQAKRDQHLGAALRRVLAEAEAVGQSWSCRCGHHAGMAGGCTNSGAGCLCRCHDPKEPQS